MTMPYVEFRWADNRYMPVNPLHYHNYSEVIFYESEYPMEYQVGNQRFLLKHGDMLCIPAGIQHRDLWKGDAKCSYRRYVMWVNDTFWQKVYHAFPDSEFESKLPSYHLQIGGTPWEVKFLELMRKGVEEFSARKPMWHLEMVNTAMQVSVCMDRAIRDMRLKPLQALQADLIDQVLCHIENNYQNPIDLETLATHFHVSESTISHAFRQRSGISIPQCITQCRLSAAEKLIRQGIPLEQVKEQVGFADYTTFFKAFKRHYGISPREFKKRYP